VKKAAHREYGLAELELDTNNGIFSGLGKALPVWMSHGTPRMKCRGISSGWDISKTPAIAAIANLEAKLYGCAISSGSSAHSRRTEAL